MKVFIKRKWTKKKFSVGIIRKKFCGGNFQLEWNCLEGIFLVGGILCGKKLYREGFPVRGRNFPWRVKLDSPALFKKDQTLN